MKDRDREGSPKVSNIATFIKADEDEARKTAGGSKGVKVAEVACDSTAEDVR